MRAAYAEPEEPEPGAISGPPVPGSPGVVVRFDEGAAHAAGIPSCVWIPAAVAQRVAFASSTTTLGTSNGISLGLAHVEGRLLTLIGVGAPSPRAPVVLCAREGADMFALAVGSIVASGRFDDADHGRVMALGKRIDELDLTAIILRLEAAFWIADATPERVSLVPRSRQGMSPR